MTDIDNEVRERMRVNDRTLFSLSDILDAKAGLALVVITFLAEQTNGLLARTDALPRYLLIFQVIAVGLLCLSGIAAVGALWPRDHEVEDAAGFEQWAAQLRAYYSNAAKVEQAFEEGALTRLRERIAKGRAVTEAKSGLLSWAFLAAGAALVLNLFTILGLALND